MTSKYFLNKFAKKYNVKKWYYVNANPFIMEDGRIFQHQTCINMETLFANGENKTVCIYKEYENKTVRGTIINV